MHLTPSPDVVWGTGLFQPSLNASWWHLSFFFFLSDSNWVHLRCKTRLHLNGLFGIFNGAELYLYSTCTVVLTVNNLHWNLKFGSENTSSPSWPFTALMVSMRYLCSCCGTPNLRHRLQSLLHILNPYENGGTVGQWRQSKGRGKVKLKETGDNSR